MCQTPCKEVYRLASLGFLHPQKLADLCISQDWLGYAVVTNTPPVLEVTYSSFLTHSYILSIVQLAALLPCPHSRTQVMGSTVASLGAHRERAGGITN